MDGMQIIDEDKNEVNISDATYLRQQSKELTEMGD
jgi:hypothetical protein